MTNVSAAAEAAASAWAPEGRSRLGAAIPCPAQRVGAEQVGCCVPRQPGRGMVHSVFRQACNIETSEGALITLLAPGAGNLPHGIRCRSGTLSSFEVLLRPGQTVVASADTLEVLEAALAVDLSGACCWSGEIGQYPIDARWSRVRHALTAVRSIVKARADGGFDAGCGVSVSGLCHRQPQTGAPADTGARRLHRRACARAGLCTGRRQSPQCRAAGAFVQRYCRDWITGLLPFARVSAGRGELHVLPPGP